MLARFISATALSALPRPFNSIHRQLNYTGQRRDSTGLLYYHARYYNPVIARFISADRVVPGAGALTVAPNGATARTAWGDGGAGPANPQELNRYSYVTNNPIKNTDPTGHCFEVLSCTLEGAAADSVVEGQDE